MYVHKQNPEIIIKCGDKKFYCGVILVGKKYAKS